MFTLEGLTCNVGTMFLLYPDLNGYCNVHGHEANVKDNIYEHIAHFYP